MSAPASSYRPTHEWNITAAIAAWVLPGLGHWWLGEKQRGSILAASIGVRWLAGFILGGISVFDHKEHPGWFWLAQVHLAPAIGADFALQELKTHGTPLPNNHPAYEPGFGRVSEQGILYTALAGLLNLLAIMDVIYRDPNRRRRDNEVVGATPRAGPATGGPTR